MQSGAENISLKPADFSICVTQRSLQNFGSQIWGQTHSRLLDELTFQRHPICSIRNGKVSFQSCIKHSRRLSKFSVVLKIMEHSIEVYMTYRFTWSLNLAKKHVLFYLSPESLTIYLQESLFFQICIFWHGSLYFGPIHYLKLTFVYL